MSAVQELEPLHEAKVFGYHEKTVQLPVNDFVMLPQIRDQENSAYADLKQSIKTRGLLSMVDVVPLDEEQFRTYVDFVNRTWRKDIKVEDYYHQQQSDGLFYVVAAGHTRTEIVCELQDEDPSGTPYQMVAKVHPISSPAQIIALQHEENLQSQPSKERSATAIVETYMFGLETGEWKSKAEFLRQYDGQISRHTLNAAMGFAQLPEDARAFVFSGELPYLAAVKLGSSTDLILDYVCSKLGYDTLPDEAIPEIEEAYRKKIGQIITGIQNRPTKLNSTAARNYVIGQVRTMRDYLDAKRQKNNDGQGEIELVDYSEDYLKTLTREYNAALRDMRMRSIASVSKAIQLHQELAGDGNVTRELQDKLAKRTQAFGMRGLYAVTI